MTALKCLVTGDIAEKLGYYKPAQIHAKFLPGLGEGGKMSASMPETAIFTTDSPDLAEKKVLGAFTGGGSTIKEHREKGGKPRVCSIFAYYFYLFEEDDNKLKELEKNCLSGTLICGECKAILSDRIKRFLVDFQLKREQSRDLLNHFLLK